MSRLFFSRLLSTLPLVALCCVASPVKAEVCDKVLGDGAPPWLMNAPLWVYLLYEVVSVLELVLIGIALMTLICPKFRWLTLAMTLFSAWVSWISMQDYLYPDRVVAAARHEGCGGIYLAGAIVSPTVTIFLIASFLSTFRQMRKPHA